MSGSDAAFHTIVAAIRPLLKERGFRQAPSMEPGRRTATFRAGGEGVLVGWDPGSRALTLEAREPEYGGSWTDMVLKFIDLAGASDGEIDEVIGIFRDELTIYFTQIGTAPG